MEAYAGLLSELADIVDEGRIRGTGRVDQIHRYGSIGCCRTRLQPGDEWGNADPPADPELAAALAAEVETTIRPFDGDGLPHPQHLRQRAGVIAQPLDAEYHLTVLPPSRGNGKGVGTFAAFKADEGELAGLMSGPCGIEPHADFEDRIAEILFEILHPANGAAGVADAAEQRYHRRCRTACEQHGRGRPDGSGPVGRRHQDDGVESQ